jgi:hypothetical protein
VVAPFGVAAIAAIGILLLAPATVRAQSAIAGQVTDATGAVLPGVTVEASSPALIEGARTVVTDSQGRYAIEALRPGIYKVTFTLQGFSVLIRDDIELVSNFTAPISAQLKVGAVEESLTVSGQSPLVDVQRTASQQVLTRDVLDALPTGRNNWSVGMTLPAVTSRTAAGGAVSDVGGLVSSVTVPLSAPGEQYLPRLTQLDLKFGKLFRYRGTSIQPQLGIFNATNEATVLAQNNSFGPTLDRVQSILDGRVVRLSVQVDF